MISKKNTAPELNWAVFKNEDGTTTRLSWEELKLEENGTKYGYLEMNISDTNIFDCAFCNCEDLLSITIPNSVKNIGGWAFDYCENLTSIVIPDSVAFIDQFAFRHCSALSSIKYEGQVFSKISEFAEKFSENFGVMAVELQ